MEIGSLRYRTGIEIKIAGMIREKESQRTQNCAVTSFHLPIRLGMVNCCKHAMDGNQMEDF